MKRHYSLFFTTLTAFLFTATLSIHLFAGQVTEDQAKEIALDHAGVKAEDVSFLVSELESEKGQQIFNVEFMTKAFDEYDYEIKAEDGTILSADFEKKARPSSGNNGGKEITMEQAKEIALQHINLKPEQVTFLKEKIDLDDGILIYEIEFYTDSYQKYDYDIDGKTGEILAWDFDSDSSFARRDAARKNESSRSQTSTDQKQQDSSNTAITLDDAKAAALKKANLKDNQVTWGAVYKEHDDGRLIYKGEFFSNSLEYEFEIDAATGKIIDWDIESIFD